MKIFCAAFFVLFLLQQVTFSQPAFTSVDEVKYNSWFADGYSPLIAVNNNGSIMLVQGNTTQWYNPDLSLAWTEHTNNYKSYIPLSLGNGKWAKLTSRDTSLNGWGYKFFHFKRYDQNYQPIDLKSMIFSTLYVTDYLPEPDEYISSQEFYVRGFKNETSVYASVNVLNDLISAGPRSISLTHELVLWDLNSIEDSVKFDINSNGGSNQYWWLGEVYRPDDKGFDIYGVPNYAISPTFNKQFIYYSREQKDAGYYPSFIPKYIRSIKIFNEKGDSLSGKIILDSLEASSTDLTERVVFGKNNDLFVLHRKVPIDTIISEHFSLSGVQLEFSKVILRDVRTFNSLRHGKSINPDLSQRLRRADYDIRNLSNGKFIIVWSGLDLDSTSHIYYGILNEDMTWIDQPKRISDSTGSQYLPDFALNSDTVSVTWIDDQNSIISTVIKRIKMNQITDVKNEETQPTQFGIQEIYPNPFSTSTTIRFSITAGTLNSTSLRLFNLLGREVKTLFEGEAESGTHTVQFNTNGLPNGVYQVVLQCGNKTEHRSIVLLKENKYIPLH